MIWIVAVNLAILMREWWIGWRMGHGHVQRWGSVYLKPPPPVIDAIDADLRPVIDADRGRRKDQILGMTCFLGEKP